MPTSHTNYAVGNIASLHNTLLRGGLDDALTK